MSDLVVTQKTPAEKTPAPSTALETQVFNLTAEVERLREAQNHPHASTTEAILATQRLAADLTNAQSQLEEVKSQLTELKAAAEKKKDPPSDAASLAPPDLSASQPPGQPLQKSLPEERKLLSWF